MGERFDHRAVGSGTVSVWELMSALGPTVVWADRHGPIRPVLALSQRAAGQAAARRSP